MVRLKMPVIAKPVRVGSCVAGSPCGLMTTPAFAALPDLDWNSYFDWNSSGWPSWLLMGAIAVLVVGLVLKASRPANSANPVSRETRAGGYTRRIGTMPIYPTEPIDTKLMS